MAAKQDVEPNFGSLRVLKPPLHRDRDNVFGKPFQAMAGDPLRLAADPLQPTPLANSAKAAGGRMVPFRGWRWQCNTRLVEEHRRCASAAGVFENISTWVCFTHKGGWGESALHRLGYPRTRSHRPAKRFLTPCCSTRRAAPQ